MHSQIFSTREKVEHETAERCSIQELSNSPDDPDVSIARARVESGVTTALHRLRDTDERYLILEGNGLVEIGDLPVAEVSVGDVVWIPRNASQRIQNTGPEALVFLCICSPRFQPECYEALEEEQREHQRTLKRSMGLA